ncbi:hypothetical protein AB0C84_07945 [Actinomadura sp. NPDC048955]|uniref:hypothetical protein n=1 Tax=Actinomadura sp. NPDC048955 TaxID=3158228 RepID=UPI0033C76B98
MPRSTLARPRCPAGEGAIAVTRQASRSSGLIEAGKPVTAPQHFRESAAFEAEDLEQFAPRLAAGQGEALDGRADGGPVAVDQNVPGDEHAPGHARLEPGGAERVAEEVGRVQRGGLVEPSAVEASPHPPHQGAGVLACGHRRDTSAPRRGPSGRCPPSTKA